MYPCYNELAIKGGVKNEKRKWMILVSVSKNNERKGIKNDDARR